LLPLHLVERLDAIDEPGGSERWIKKIWNRNSVTPDRKEHEMESGKGER